MSMSTSVALRQVRPDLGALAAADALREIVGALLTHGLLVSVAILIISGVAWAVASSAGSWQGASRAKVGVLVALGGAVLTGGALAWANWLIHIGLRL